MQTTACVGLAFLPAKQVGSKGSHHKAAGASAAAPPPVLIGGVLESKPVLARRLPCFSWSHRVRTWATAATTPRQDLLDEEGHQIIRRRNVSNFEPSVWGDFFLTYSSPLASSTEQLTRMIERANHLTRNVSKTISASSNCSLYERMQLINVLERLCLDHLFKEEINVILSEIYKTNEVSESDLQTTALWFYLLRKHGYQVSPDVFAKFTDEQGNFAANNPLDVLSLYNAAYLRTNGERILDEVVSFTKRSLESVLTNLQGPLAHEVKSALEIPFPRRVRIYEAKYYISVHGQANEVIMELAKLNSNIMQLQYQQELRIITRWWKDLELQSRLSFARDRVVECYFWIVGVYYEPSYSRGRIILTKVLAIVSILDDTYDVYGTLQECELFTSCVERWDRMVADGLPENMKFIFGKIMDTYQSIENELSPEEKYRMPYLKNFIIDLVRAYNNEVKWREEGYVLATVDEHLQVSARSGACHLLSCASFVGMTDIATKEAFDWVSNVPKLVRTLCIILRLSDDLKSYEREKMTCHVASTIESCMKEHKVPVHVARQIIQDMIEETWKDFNEEWFNTNNHVPKELLERIFNLTRTMEFMYKQDDAYTNSHVIKDTISKLFVEHVPMI
ncbi:alpha-terpineol synthase, chloroplastic-like [Miscanthus floridulus]|uniref:alpha-terpineol synthase, chloroplastic-like n=1 Tax=Miscanthus floridulus TaxID=154761 RepID=UPI00345916A0